MESRLEKRKKKTLKKNKKDADFDYEDDNDDREEKAFKKKAPAIRRPSRNVRAPPKQKPRRSRGVAEVEELLKILFLELGAEIKEGGQSAPFVARLQDLEFDFQAGFSDEILLGSSNVGSYLNSLDNMLNNLDDKLDNAGDWTLVHSLIKKLNTKSCQIVLNYVSVLFFGFFIALIILIVFFTLEEDWCTDPQFCNRERVQSDLRMVSENMGSLSGDLRKLRSANDRGKIYSQTSRVENEQSSMTEKSDNRSIQSETRKEDKTSQEVFLNKTFSLRDKSLRGKPAPKSKTPKAPKTPKEKPGQSPPAPSHEHEPVCKPVGRHEDPDVRQAQLAEFKKIKRRVLKKIAKTLKEVYSLDRQASEKVAL